MITFREMIDLLSPSNKKGDNKSDTHYELKAAMRAACYIMSPGIFTSDMILLRVGDKCGYDPSLVRSQIMAWCKSGALADVGYVRKGHASVPCYIIRDARKLV